MRNNHKERGIHGWKHLFLSHMSENMIACAQNQVFLEILFYVFYALLEFRNYKIA
jgi:hypothetical protein